MSASSPDAFRPMTSRGRPTTRHRLRSHQLVRLHSSGEEDSEDDVEDISGFEMVAPLSQLPILDPSIRTTPLAGPSNPIPFSLPPSDYIPPGVFVTSPSPPATPTHCESPAPPYSPPSVRDIADRLQNVYITPHTVYPTVITGVVAAASSGPFSPDWNDGVPWLAPENTQCSTCEETIAATSGVPRNISRGGFTSRDDAINAFQRQLASGTVRVVRD
ncbi:hypothetical protein ACG7TL_006015 [Trametes sanguinea]